MNDKNEDFENYLRQFQLRSSGAQVPFHRSASRLRRWWISGITAAVAAAAVIATIETRSPVPPEPPIEKPRQLLPPAPAVSSIFRVVPPPSPVREPAPKPSRPSAPKPRPIVSQPAAATIEPLQTQTEPPKTRGQELFDRVCSACHDLNVAGSRRFSSRDDAESYLSMKRSKGAQLGDEEFPILADYLFQRFGKK